MVESLLEHRFVPVVAPLGVARDGSTAYNINGDTAAGALAGALRVDAFVAITDVPKIRRRLDDPNSTVDLLTAGEAEEWRAAGSLAGGMIPKVDSAFDGTPSQVRSARSSPAPARRRSAKRWPARGPSSSSSLVIEPPLVSVVTKAIDDKMPLDGKLFSYRFG